MNIQDEPSAFAAAIENLRNILTPLDNHQSIHRKNRVTQTPSIVTRRGYENSGQSEHEGQPSTDQPRAPRPLLEKLVKFFKSQISDVRSEITRD
jgi:hypothetical protein